MSHVMILIPVLASVLLVLLIVGFIIKRIVSMAILAILIGGGIYLSGGLRFAMRDGHHVAEHALGQLQRAEHDLLTHHGHCSTTQRELQQAGRSVRKAIRHGAKITIKPSRAGCTISVRKLAGGPVSGRARR